jgi:hypothetical protein
MDLEEKAKYNPEKADQLKKRNENSHRIRHVLIIIFTNLRPKRKFQYQHPV